MPRATDRVRRLTRSTPSPCWLAIAAMLLAAWAPTSATAGPIFEPWTNKYGWALMMPYRPLSEFTLALNNASADLEPNEPTEGGQLTRSLWAHFTAPSDTRVVIHTVGSDVPTVIVVYTGTSLAGLTRVTGSRDAAVPGLPAGQSLVQFLAVAGVGYSIQIGSAGSAPGGDLSLNVFQHPPAGGLSVLLSRLLSSSGSVAWNGRDFTCSTTTCSTPEFVLHNSRAQTLDVTASTSFGALFGTPAPISLGPGEVATVPLPAVANSDFLTTRTLTGEFAFSGKAGGVEVVREAVPGTVFVRGTAGDTTLQAATLPTSRAGALGQVLTAFATVINAGAQPAIGCVVRSQDAARANVTFQETDSATNTPVGLPNQPVSIAPGAAKTFVFTLTSQSPELGDPEFGGPVQFQCANAFPASANLANGFVVTALGTVTLADMISIGATPTGDGVVNVRPGTGGAFAVATVNIGVPATVTARLLYSRPFGEDDPARQFTAFICETNPSTGVCLAPPALTVSFTATPGVPHTFAVFVQRPAVDPGFDPGQRRIFVKFEEQSPPNFLGQNPIPLLVGSTSVAPRAQ